MDKFRKKPVLIEAAQFDGTKESANHILAWVGSCGLSASRIHRTKPEMGVCVHAADDNVTALPGDWIFKNADGEFDVVNDEGFRGFYELVE
jgi:hypothetical protein